MKFSQKEIEDLLISWLILSLAFAMFRLEDVSIPYVPYALLQNPIFVLQMFIIVGTAFVLHELSHKYVAQKYGLWAEYRKWTWGLILAFFLSLTGVIFFAAPGAVMIMSTAWITPEIEAKTSIAGPLTNITVGIVAMLIGATGYFSNFLTELAVINFFLAVFNLLPIPPMDGSKILKYNGMIWIIAFGTAAVLLFLAY
jgi:Zn-dependent protease